MFVTSCTHVGAENEVILYSKIKSVFGSVLIFFQVYYEYNPTIVNRMFLFPAIHFQ